VIKIINKVKYKVLIILNKLIPRSIYYIHIGKTGGTWYREMIWKTCIPFLYKVVIGGHGSKFQDIAFKYKIIIIPIRDPYSRIKSGFNSRLRQGAPAYNNPWSNEEVAFFAKYPSFEVFVSSILQDKDGEGGYKTFKKINIHAKYGYEYYFSKLDLREAFKNKDIFIIRQESLGEDFDKIIKHFSCKIFSKSKEFKRILHSSNDKKIETLPNKKIVEFKNKYLSNEYKYFKIISNYKPPNENKF
jgi:hypothetical protein